MMHFNINFLRKLSLILFAFLSLHSYSQSHTQKIDNLIQMAEYKYGLDDRLVNGVVGQNLPPRTKGHPYFIRNGWFKSNLYMNGVFYKDVEIAYNIELDEIYFIDRMNRQVQIVVLNKTLIDSVRIQDHLLVNSDKLGIKNPIGYMEVIYEGNYTAFLKHKINYTIKHDDSYEFRNYNKKKTSVYIFRNNLLINLKNTKDVYKEFTSHQTDIKKFIRQNKIRFGNADRVQLSNLLKYCDEISSR